MTTHYCLYFLAHITGLGGVAVFTCSGLTEVAGFFKVRGGNVREKYVVWQNFQVCSPPTGCGVSEQPQTSYIDGESSQSSLSNSSSRRDVRMT